MGNPISLVLNPVVQVLLPGAGTRGFVDLGSRVIQIKLVILSYIFTVTHEEQFTRVILLRRVKHQR